MNCSICGREIAAKRLLAVPSTHLCRNCKERHDERRLRANCPVIANSLATNSLSDLDEMSKTAREIGGLE
jgi:hypothetical protein